MGLASALSTALTGLSASETTIDVVGNNLSNSNTVGFKASRVTFATQFLQTLSLGSAPTAETGGNNPRQLGLGSMIADVTPNFTQGTIQISSSSTDMAIQDDGFFIVQGASGEQLYTRNGIFKMNAENQLVTTTGQRLLGFGVDEQFQIQTTTLQPIVIPLGSAAVAQATQNAFVQGTLSPTGDLATQAAIIETDALGAAEYLGPSSGAGSWSATQPISSLPTLTGEATTGADPTDYRYAVTFYNTALGLETDLSADISGGNVRTPDAIGTLGTSVFLSNLPSLVGQYDKLRIYRTHGDTPGVYYEVAELTAAQLAASGNTYTDALADPAIPPFAGTTGSGPDVSHTTASNGELSANATYRYKVVFYNSQTDTEGLPSNEIALALADGQDHISLSGLPVDNTGTYDRVRIYRTLANESGVYYLVTTEAMGTATYSDTTSDATLLAADERLDTSMLSTTTYKYYFTFYDDAGLESRPQLVPTECLMNTEGRIELKDLPVPEDGSHPSPGSWTGIRIYRNTASHQSDFYLVDDLATISPGLCYTDSTSDATLEQQTKKLDFVGAPITYSTLLTNVLRWDGSAYQQVFQVGKFQFTPRKGDRALATKELNITETTTVQQLITFMEQAMGIQKSPGPDPNHPIPKSDLATGGTIDPGGSLTNGRIRFVGNNGTSSAVEIALSGMALTPTGQVAAQTVNMPFSTLQSALGESAVTDFIAYDSLGIPLNVRLTAVLESRDSAQTTYRWFADSSDNDPSTGVGIAVGTGLITFNGEGSFIAATANTVSIERKHVAAVSPESFKLDFSQISGLSAAHSSLAVSRQDGSAAGTLTSFITGEDGLIRGVFSNGVTRDLGQIILARFANPAGLEQRGENVYAPGVNSGLPIMGNPGEQGIGTIVAGATELSNTDIGGGLIDLILASTMYRSNARVITTIQQMFDELLNLRR